MILDTKRSIAKRANPVKQETPIYDRFQMGLAN